MKTIKYNNRIETRNDEGKLHSFNDKFAIEYNDGTKYWYKEGKLHRLGGPAKEWNDGVKFWYYEGKEIKCNSTEEFFKIINLKAFW